MTRDNFVSIKMLVLKKILNKILNSFSFSKQGNPLIITSLPSSSQDYYSPDIVFAGEFLDPVYYSTNLHLDYNFDNNISSNKLVIHKISNILNIGYSVFIQFS